MAMKVCSSRLSIKQALYSILVMVMFAQWVFYYHRTDDVNRSDRHRRMPAKVCKLSVLASDEQYLNYFNSPNSNPNTCDNWRPFGRDTDGPDHEQFVCMDAQYNISRNKCLVFSYGVTNWGFEVDFDRMGCQVYALDPLLPQEKQKQKPGSNINFLDIGLGTSGGRQVALVDGKEVSFEVTRFEDLIQDLKLDAFFVDYLKLDVPGFAEEFLQDILLTSPRIISQVKQFSVTIDHTNLQNQAPLLAGSGVGEMEEGRRVNLYYIAMWTYLQMLECLGFSLLQSMPMGPHAHRVVWGRVPTQEDRKDLEKWSMEYDYET